MGAGNSQGEAKGVAFIELTSAQYKPLDTIKGNVHLKLDENIVAPAVFLTIVGSEYGHWVIRRSRQRMFGTTSNDREYYDEHYRYRNHIIQQSVTLLRSTDGVLPQGDYTIPFQITLPEKLPPSNEVKGNKFEANIKYFLQVQCSPQERKMVFSKTDIWILNTELGRVQELTLSDSRKIDYCCCCGRGKQKMTVSLDSPYYTPGQPINIHVEMNNVENSSGTKKIIVELGLDLHFSMRGSNKSIFYILQTDEGPGVPQHQLSQVNFQVNTDKSIEDLRLGQSTTGRIYTCQYKLRITAVTSGWFSSEGPIVEFPIGMAMPFIPHRELPQAPVDWNPYVNQEAILLLNSGHVYEKPAFTDNEDVSAGQHAYEILDKWI